MSKNHENVIKLKVSLWQRLKIWWGRNTLDIGRRLEYLQKIANEDQPHNVVCRFGHKRPVQYCASCGHLAE